MPVKTFRLSEKRRLRKVTVNNSHTVRFIQNSGELVSGIFNSLKMPRSDIPGCPNQGEVFDAHIYLRFNFLMSDE
jgi:hypothetical protein